MDYVRRGGDMNDVVFKYPFSVDPVQAVLRLGLPRGAKFLLFAVQGKAPTLWFEVDSQLPPVSRTFVLFGTGQYLPEHKRLEHLGSAIGYEGQLVLHCYEDITT